MQDYEQLGAFYLGRLYDVKESQARDELLLYDSKDLTTHAVCVGMTGSGKTGLCVSLLEEAAIDGIPAIAIDPKGDLGNLLLTFPRLEPADFEPWVDASEAARQGQTTSQFAQTVAARWREGMASWGQSPDRIQRLRDAVDLALYTPGSTAGLPLTVLKSFAAPPEAVRQDSESLREKISSSASALLALLGIDADPIQSREHILVSNLLDHAWREGRHLDVALLIREIQDPPFPRVGVFDLETFFPAKDRLDLAMKLNNLLASPAFAGWMEGEPLDVQRLLYTPAGKPRLTILSIAHLSESERMFFVTLLLNEVLAWVRCQAGTSSLRAILYMDEVFGYFPPTANPPAKRPMLTLLKQARAYGLGVVLSTQNPVDLDYKGLSNTGTWFLGRLQTERDKARVLEGLEGVAAQSGQSFQRAEMDQILSGLGKRVFLLNNVHEDHPVTFQTRWALSYLRGPLTRAQIQQLTRSVPSPASGPPPTRLPATPTDAPAGSPTASAPGQLPSAGDSSIPSDADRRAAADAATPQPPGVATGDVMTAIPVIPQEVVQRYQAVTLDAPAESRVVYRAALLGTAQLHYCRASYQVDVWRSVSLVEPLADQLPARPWQDARPVDAQRLRFADPPRNAECAALPRGLDKLTTYKKWERELKDLLYRTRKATIWTCAELKRYSEPDMTEGDFRAALRQAAREERDRALEKLRDRFGSRLSSLQQRQAAAREQLTREQAQAQRETWDSAVNVGTSILGALLGRKLASRTNVRKAGSSLRKMNRAADQRQDVARVEEKLAQLAREQQELSREFELEAELVRQQYDPDLLKLETLELAPTKSDIDIRLALLWVPWSVSTEGRWLEPLAGAEVATLAGTPPR